MDGTARAIVFDSPQAPLRTAELEIPTLRPGEVLAEVIICTLCGSDIHSFQGARQTPCPTILGHEILGRVAELPNGPPVLDVLGRAIRVGQRITWTVTASCGQCFFCTSGLPQKCVSLVKYGHERLSDEHALSGGLAEYCVLAAGTAIMPIPAEVPDPVACPVNCATATVAAAFRYAGPITSKNVLIQGVGMLGVTACAMADHGGASHVIATDVNSDRLEQSFRFGATQTLDAAEARPETRRRIDRLTNGRGVDVVFEMSGSAAATESAIEMLRIGGRLILVGAVYPADPVRLDAEKIVRNLLTIQGVHNYTPQDLQTAVAFLCDVHQRYPISDLVLDGFGLHQAQAAFEAAARGKAYRVGVRPGRTIES